MLGRTKKVRQITRKIPDSAFGHPSIIVKEIRRSGVIIYWSLVYDRTIWGWIDHANNRSLDDLKSLVSWAFPSARIGSAKIYEVKT